MSGNTIAVDHCTGISEEEEGGGGLCLSVCASSCGAENDREWVEREGRVSEALDAQTKTRRARRHVVAETMRVACYDKEKKRR